MILVIGGCASGKKTYVRGLGYTDGQMSEDPSSSAPVLIGLEEALRSNPPSDALFEALCTKDVIICREVGCGVVPIDPDERAWRELVGRTCNRLAARAAKVIRLTCGIALELK